jgi:hypothetical protein
MPCSVTNQAGPYIEVRISGVMTVADMRKMQDLATAIIAGGETPAPRYSMFSGLERRRLERHRLPDQTR